MLFGEAPTSSAVRPPLSSRNIVEEMLIADRVGMKVALGENPAGVYRAKIRAPSTRMATAALLRMAEQGPGLRDEKSSSC